MYCWSRSWRCSLYSETLNTTQTNWKRMLMNMKPSSHVGYVVSGNSMVWRSASVHRSVVMPSWSESVAPSTQNARNPARFSSAAGKMRRM